MYYNVLVSRVQSEMWNRGISRPQSLKIPLLFYIFCPFTQLCICRQNPNLYSITNNMGFLSYVNNTNWHNTSGHWTHHTCYWHITVMGWRRTRLQHTFTFFLVALPRQNSELTRHCMGVFGSPPTTTGMARNLKIILQLDRSAPNWTWFCNLQSERS